MRDRRTIVFSLMGTLAAASLARCTSAVPSRATPVRDAPPDTPKATVIEGKPPILDFGDGVRVPCDKSAFLTLWEGKTYWLTFGAGRSHYREQAQGLAVKYARGAMKLLLITMALAPGRLAKVEGSGWRLKSGDIRDFVKGDVELPGNPFWPNNDAFLGFGAADAPVVSSMGVGTMDPGTMTPSVGGFDLPGSWLYVDAFSAYVISKKDITLEDVRRLAQIVPPD